MSFLPFDATCDNPPKVAKKRLFEVTNAVIIVC